MNNEKQSDEFFMSQALIEAEKALKQGEVPIGAVIVHRNRIVSRAHNLTETLCDPTAHAEMQAITAATSSIQGKYLPECRLYVTVEPCPMCAAACYWAQIGEVIYGAKDPKRGYSTVSEKLLHPKTVVKSGVKQQEAEKLMKDFFKILRDK